VSKTPYPSIPDPGNTQEQLAACVRAMRQCISLLVLNSTGAAGSFLTSNDGVSFNSGIASAATAAQLAAQDAQNVASNLAAASASLGSSVSTLTGNMGSANTNIAALQANVTTLNGEVAALTSDLASSNLAISTLQGAMTAVQAAIAAMNPLFSVTGTFGGSVFTITGVKSLDGTVSHPT
jgi:hypothetical protein